MFNRRLYFINKAISDLKMFKRDLNPHQAQRVGRIIWMLEQGKVDIQIALEEAIQLGYRNSEFDGDWVGRPDDDFE